jgi:hypothetical protein
MPVRVGDDSDCFSDGFAPDLKKIENRINLSILVKF